MIKFYTFFKNVQICPLSYC